MKVLRHAGGGQGMSDRERLLGISKWHQEEAARLLSLSRVLKRRHRAYVATIAAVDQHNDFYTALRQIAERMPSTLSFKEMVRQEREICGRPVPGPTFSICIRNPGHEGQHRSVKQ
jgi:hypothetical protein